MHSDSMFEPPVQIHRLPATAMGQLCLDERTQSLAILVLILVEFSSVVGLSVIQNLPLTVRPSHSELRVGLWLLAWVGVQQSVLCTRYLHSHRLHP